MRLSFLSLISVLLCNVAVVHAADDPDVEARDAHRLKMKQVADSIQLTDAEDGTPITLLSDPVLLYTDATRATYESSLWIWGDAGRPAAIMAVEYYPNRPKASHWLYEIVSVSDSRIAATRDNELNWVAQQGGVTLKDVPDADAPADGAVPRFRQMKQLLRRFTASESAVIEGRIELRPMASALHRYSDPDAQIIDGAVFAFANGTNPEVFMLLEAHETAEGQPAWKYAVGRMTGGAVAVSIDGQEVWTCDAADPPASRESYVNGWFTLDPQ